MTFPRFDKDLLMFFVSVVRLATSFLSRSDPARSTKFKFPMQVSFLAACFPVSRILVTEWDRDDLKKDNIFYYFSSKQKIFKTKLFFNFKKSFTSRLHSWLQPLDSFGRLTNTRTTFLDSQLARCEGSSRTNHSFYYPPCEFRGSWSGSPGDQQCARYKSPKYSLQQCNPILRVGNSSSP